MSNKFETYTVLHPTETLALESALEALATEPLLDELSGIARELHRGEVVREQRCVVAESPAYDGPVTRSYVVASEPTNPSGLGTGSSFDSAWQPDVFAEHFCARSG